MRKLVYYVAVTIDGFIAGPGGEFDFFPIEPDVMRVLTPELPETVPTAFREQAGVADLPNRRFDTVVMGRGTYDPAFKEGITSPYAHLKQYVFSRSLAGTDSEVEIVSADAAEFVRGLKRQEGADIWLCGGGDLAAQLAGEIDEMIIKRNPIVIGDGIRLFDGPFEAHRFALTETRPFESGVVVMRYAKN
ncbi:dihydrofolate reductase family protein [Actinomadura rugatobispora]|uniref:Dihydrofolate reductase family protein n=1 Tax=Actinomadura rugatobispora TaxID=1994 RepID=A0ABW0ZWN2_9ACTN|nr:dihydrofolate reductase family protein [Actinomadura rugatobispora]